MIRICAIILFFGCAANADCTSLLSSSKQWIMPDHFHVQDVPGFFIAYSPKHRITESGTRLSDLIFQTKRLFAQGRRVLEDRIEIPFVRDQETSADVARRLQKTGEELLRIPSFDGCNIPAFHGVILRDLKPVANVVLRNVVSSSPEALARKVSDVMKLINRYSKIEAWEKKFEETKGTDRKRTQKWLDEAPSLFGVNGNTPRPVRIFIFFQPESGFGLRHVSDRFIGSIQDRIRLRAPLIESLTFVEGSRALEITENQPELDH